MPLDPLLEKHSGELLILVLTLLMLGTLLIVVPQLLRSHQRALELAQAEHMRALEQGLPVPQMDERSLFAGRVALLVPTVGLCAAGTVTCFLVAYRSENLFAVSLAVWCVAGVVSLAAITGSVTLMARLAQLHAGQEDEEFSDSPVEKKRGL